MTTIGILESPTFVSALSPLVTTILMALLYWGWQQFKRLLNENRELVGKMDEKLDSIVRSQDDHSASDRALFDNHAGRISKAEGALEVLVQIAAAKESKTHTP